MCWNISRNNAGEFQRGFFHDEAGEGHHAVEVRAFADQVAVFIEAEQHGGDFEDGIGLRVETAALHVNNHRQETAKAACHDGTARGLEIGAFAFLYFYVFTQLFRH